MRSVSARWLTACLALVAAVSLPGGSIYAQAVRVQELVRSTPGGTARGFIATIDLSDPALEVVVTGPPPAGSPGDAVLQRTDTWQAANNLTLAVNANFFGSLGGSNADIIGLSISDGVVVSPVRVAGPQPDPAVAFRPGSATIGYLASNQLAGVTEAVAGVGPGTGDSLPGTLLVSAGVATGEGARVDPINRNPRTAVGVDVTGTRLIVITIDGRQPGWSVGMTLPELADLLIERGAHNAVNLDGGGSTSFVYDPPGPTRLVNRPSDGAFRAVANHLGFRDASAPPPPAARPIRGVWLRPPSTLDGLDTVLDQIAEAGITDLYLETLYWGVATNSSNVFERRFTFDYLQEAITRAARRGIRTHAWLETGYWQYSSTGASNFTNNPEWRVLNIATGQTGGDGTPGQVFANLANPGVQAKLRSYAAELAGYAGLHGIHIDYHRYPLDNNTGDSFPAPWSYDTWAVSTFQGMYGVNPSTAAATTGGSHWSKFLSFRRAGISEAANQIHLGLNSVSPALDFSCAIFATAMSSTSQLTKCQDWPAWAANGFVETIIPMAYGSSTSSIRSDIQTTLGQAAGRRVAAGLAITGTSSHPAITAQLSAIVQDGVQSFVFFDATPFSDPAKRTELRQWLVGSATPIVGDVGRDGRLDGGDLANFNAVYRGTPITATPPLAPFDIDGSGVIDAADQAALGGLILRSVFTDTGAVGMAHVRAVARASGQTPARPDVVHLFDLNADGRIDGADLESLRGLVLSRPGSIAADVDGDGILTIEDLHAQERAPADVDGDGLTTAADTEFLRFLLRAGESADVLSGRE